MNKSVAVLLLALVALVAGVSAQAYSCPTYIRAAHSYNPTSAPVPNYDIWVNGKKQWSNIAFRAITPYIVVLAGTVEIGIKPAGQDSAAFLSSVSFKAVGNSAYTVGFTGPLAGPTGQLITNKAPIVNQDVLRVPNPDRFSGLWYRWSETGLSIDFRAVAGNPTAPSNVAWAQDAMRISTLAGKTVIPYPEIPVGTYSFYPVLMNATQPLFNSNRSEYVRVAGLTARAGGYVYDFFAHGDSLLNNHPNNLAISSTETRVSFDAASGCTLLPDVGGTPRLTSSAATVGASLLLSVALAAFALFA